MKEEVLKKLHESGLKYYDLPSFDEFKQDMQSEETALKFKQSMSEHYDMPDDSQFLIDIGIQDVKKKINQTYPLWKRVRNLLQKALILPILQIKT